MGGAAGGDGGSGDSDDRVVDMMMWVVDGGVCGCGGVSVGGAELPPTGYMCTAISILPV